MSIDGQWQAPGGDVPPEAAGGGQAPTGSGGGGIAAPGPPVNDGFVPPQPVDGMQQQPAYGMQQAPYAGGWYVQAPPESRGRRTKVILGVVCGIIAAAVGITLSVLQNSNSNSNFNAPTGESSPAGVIGQTDPGSTPPAGVTVPANAGGLTLMSGPEANAVVDPMKKADSASPLLSSAMFGAYEKTGTSQFFGDLTLVSLSDTPTLASAISSEGAQQVLDQNMQGSGLSDIQPETAGVSGGALSCGVETADHITMRACTWADSQSFGMLAAPLAAASAQQDATYAAAVEAAADQGS